MGRVGSEADFPFCARGVQLPGGPPVFFPLKAERSTIAGRALIVSENGLPMKHDTNSLPPQRQPLLAVSHPDGFIELYGEHITAKIIRVPVAESLEGERLAEDFIELGLPHYWRQLYFPGKRIATGTTLPLLPTTIERSLETKRSLAELNAALSGREGAE